MKSLMKLSILVLFSTNVLSADSADILVMPDWNQGKQSDSLTVTVPAGSTVWGYAYADAYLNKNGGYDSDVDGAWADAELSGPGAGNSIWVYAESYPFADWGDIGEEWVWDSMIEYANNWSSGEYYLWGEAEGPYASADVYIEW